MLQSAWAQLLALALMAILIMPAVLRLPWRSRRILVFIAAWLGIFIAAALLFNLLQ